MKLNKNIFEEEPKPKDPPPTTIPPAS